MTTMEPERPSAPPTAMSNAEAVLDEAATVVDPMEQAVDMTPLDFARRVVFVHAHPDDETIGTGATMAKYAAEGAKVTLVTCTLGEEGEVVVDELRHLAADGDDTLGQHRIDELAVACEALGVADHRFLGGPGRWRDSGMMETPTNDRPDCLWRADPEQTTRELVAVLREVRPQVVVTYDENGGYGHPDHIRAHEVTMAAFAASADPDRFAGTGEAWQVDKLYYTAVPKSVLRAGIEQLREMGGDTSFFDVDSVDDLPFGVADDVITTVVDGADYLPAKVAAMRAHRSQISVDGPFFALADHVGQRAFGVEHYLLARGRRGPGDGLDGRESDLFAGVD